MAKGIDLERPSLPRFSRLFQGAVAVDSLAPFWFGEVLVGAERLSQTGAPALPLLLRLSRFQALVKVTSRQARPAVLLSGQGRGVQRRWYPSRILGPWRQPRGTFSADPRARSGPSPEEKPVSGRLLR